MGAAVSDILVAIGERLRTQDNACTADPIFVVQQRRRTYGFDPSVSDDHVVWIHSDECVEATSEETKDLEEKFDESCGEEPDGWRRTAYQDTWEFVQPFFTRAAAEAFIAANSHRLTAPRIDVDSAYRNPEWQAVRAFLKGLDAPAGGGA